MKKFLIAGVSALTTLAVCTGAVGILATAPSTRNMFDFTGQKEQIISELAEDIINKEQIIKEKDSALLEQDEQIAGLENSNNEKDSIITEKDSEINNKNVEIKSQQTTIEELNELLAGGKEYKLPQEFSTMSSVNVINTNTNYAIISSKSNQFLGIWLLDKNSGEFIKIFDECAGFTSALDMGNGKFALATTLSLAKNYGLLVIDTNTLTCEIVNDSNTALASRIFLKNGKGVVLYGTYDIMFYDFETKTFTNYETTGFTTNLYLLKDEYLVVNYKYILNLYTGAISEIESFVTGKCFVAYDELYSVNSTSGLHRLNIETLSFELLSSEITQYYKHFEVTDNILCVTNGSPKPYFYFKDTKETKFIDARADVVVLLKNGNVALLSTNLYEYNLETLERVNSVIFDWRSLIYLPTGDLFTYYKNVLYLYAYDEDSNSYSRITYSLNSDISGYELMGDGRYMFFSSDNTGNYIFDPVTNQVSAYSIVID